MKSQFDEKKIEKASNGKLELFKLAHASVTTEAHLLWQSSELFLVANTLLAGFISTNLQRNTIIICLLSFVGIVVSMLWLLSYTRMLNYYKFRIAQAKQREPEGWMLFKEDGEAFSKGESIMINGSRYTFGIGKFSNQIIVRILVSFFIGLFLLLSTIAIFFHNLLV